MQATSSLWGAGGVLCKHEGICSQWDVVQSPWQSMVAGVATFELLGSAPWCYDARSKAYHRCDLIKRSDRPLP